MTNENRKWIERGGEIGVPILVHTEDEVKYRLIGEARAGVRNNFSKKGGLRLSINAIYPKNYSAGYLYSCMDYDTEGGGVGLRFYCLCPPTEERISFGRGGIINESRESYDGKDQHDLIRKHLHSVLYYTSPTETSKRARILRDILPEVSHYFEEALGYDINNVLRGYLRSVDITPDHLKKIIKDKKKSQCNLKIFSAFSRELRK